MFYMDAALVTLRESLEAFLIIAVWFGVVVRLGAREARSPLVAGAITAAGVAVLVAVGIDRVARDLYESSGSGEVFEGAASLVAVVVVTYMVLWMTEHTQGLVHALGSDVARAVRADRPMVLFAIAFTAVIREGLETALFLGAIAPGREAAGIAVSAGAGFAVSVSVAYLLFRGAIRLDLRRFFTVSAAMLVLLAGGLLVTAVHEFAEVGWLPVTPTAWSTAGPLPDESALGSVLKAVLGYRDTPTVLEAAAWLLYVSLVGGWFLGAPRSRRRAAMAEAKQP